MRDILIGGLLLPLRLYFQPRAFADEVAALAPDLPRDYSLWQARWKLRDPLFRRRISKLLLQTLIALLWAPVLAGLIALFGFEVNWFGLVFGLAFGMAFSLMSDVVFGVTFGVAFGIVLGFTKIIPLVMVDDIVSSVAFGIASGVMSGILVHMTRILFSKVMVIVSLVVIVGILLGVALRTEYTLGIVVVVFATSMLIMIRILLLPFQILLSLISRSIIRFRPEYVATLWRISPVRWDETILLPLPGLVGLLVALYRTDPAQGQQALDRVAVHRFQRHVVPQALIRLAQEDAMQVASLPGLAAYQRSLAWLDEDSPLPEAEKAAVLRMRDISREAAAAQESDSATNSLRRLSAAADLLAALRLQPGPFGSALTRWSQAVDAGLEAAHQRQREEEPIPQVYIRDGRPIHPAQRPDAMVPFKGRAALFRRLEAALGGQADARATFMLFGARRAGKTSVLLQLPRRLGSRCVPAFLDMQGIGGAQDSAGLLQLLVDTVLEDLRLHRQMRLPTIDRVALVADPYPELYRWLDQVEAALGDRILLFCLDEFESLEEGISAGRFDTRILNAIRHIAQHRRQIAVLLSGSHQIDELPPHWASALVTTTTLPVSFLDEADARELIERPVEGFPAIYRPAAVDRVIELTHCQPHLIQLLCSQLVERMNMARRMPPDSFVELADVAASVAPALQSGDNYLSDLWRNQAGGLLAQRVLAELACAPGERRHSTALQALEPDTLALRAALTTLQRRDLIARDGDGYRIAVPLIAEYVRQVTQI